MVIADINMTGGQAVAATMPDAIKFHQTDVSKEKDWKDLIGAVLSEYGRVDCLVNNAGTTYPNKVCLSVDWPC